MITMSVNELISYPFNFFISHCEATKPSHLIRRLRTFFLFIMLLGYINELFEFNANNLKEFNSFVNI